MRKLSQTYPQKTARHRAFYINYFKFSRKIQLKYYLKNFTAWKKKQKYVNLFPESCFWYHKLSAKTLYKDRSKKQWVNCA